MSPSSLRLPDQYGIDDTVDRVVDNFRSEIIGRERGDIPIFHHDIAPFGASRRRCAYRAPRIAITGNGGRAWSGVGEIRIVRLVVRNLRVVQPGRESIECQREIAARVPLERSGERFAFLVIND